MLESVKFLSHQWVAFGGQFVYTMLYMGVTWYLLKGLQVELIRLKKESSESKEKEFLNEEVKRGN